MQSAAYYAARRARVVAKCLLQRVYEIDHRLFSTANGFLYVVNRFQERLY